MKYYIFLLICFIFFSCIKKEKMVQYEGFYFENNTLNIYEIKEKKITVYNVIDSSSYSKEYSFNNSLINFSKENYKFKAYEKDSLVIYKFIDGKKDAFLKKLKIENFNKIDLKNKKWYKKDFKQMILSIYFNENKNLYAFINDDVEDYNFEVKYRGLFFNKFHIYTFSYILIPTEVNNEKATFLHIDYMSKKVNEISFKKANLIDLNKKLVGKWKATEDYEVSNFDTYFSYTQKEDNLNFIISNDSIETFLDYKNIEFTNDNKFKRYIQKTNKQGVYKIKKSPFIDRIFIDNGNVEFQYFDILSITEDSLKVSLSIPDLKIKYYRIKK